MKAGDLLTVIVRGADETKTWRNVIAFDMRPSRLVLRISGERYERTKKLHDVDTVIITIAPEPGEGKLVLAPESG